MRLSEHKNFVSDHCPFYDSQQSTEQKMLNLGLKSKIFGKQKKFK
jgi:hypothetical protein